MVFIGVFMMIRMQAHFVFKILFLLFFNAQCFSLPAETLILCDADTGVMKRVDDLKVADSLASFDVLTAEGTDAIALETEKNTIEVLSIVEIKTPHGSVLLGEEQEVFDSSTGQFTKVVGLTSQSTLFSRMHGDIACDEIIFHKQSTACFTISLDPLDLFFSTELQILTHNVAPAATILPALTSFFAEVAIIATGTISGAMTFYTNLDLGKNQALKNIDTLTVSHIKNPPSMATLRIPYQKSPTPISGIPLDVEVYNQIRQMPYIYSPLVLTAKVSTTGDVICSLWSVKFTGHSNKINHYQPIEVGNSTLSRTHETVKTFVKDEDAKKINLLRDAIKKWPASIPGILFKKGNIPLEIDLIKKNGIPDQIIYGLLFGPHAVQNMVNKSIAPAQILHVLNYGKAIKAYNPEWDIVIEEAADIAVVINKASRTVVNVGRYKVDIGHLNQDVPDDLDKAKANQNKKIHILQEKHNWRKFDPDPEKNWDKIVKAIKEALKNGHHWQKSEDEWRATIKIGEHIVEVGYGLKDGIRRIGSAWIKQ